MKLLLPVMLIALSLVGCVKIEGQLNISKDLKLVNSKGVAHLLKVGTYSADIDAQSSKKFTLRLNNDSDEKFVFSHSGNIPNNGPFSISSKVSGQPVDLNGDVATVVKNSNTQSATQSCTYQVAVQVCYPDSRGGRICQIEYRMAYGTQWINFYDRETNQHVNLNVNAVNSPDVSADFHGDLGYVERIITNETRCM